MKEETKIIFYGPKIKSAFVVNRYNSTGVIGLIPSLRIEYVRHYCNGLMEPRRIQIWANFLSFNAELEIELPGWYRWRKSYEEMILDGDDTVA